MIKNIQRILSIGWLVWLACVPEALGQTVFSKANPQMLTLANGHLSLSFERSTGRLTEMRNKVSGDNYLKSPLEGNLFRLYLDPKREPSLSAEVYRYRPNGTIIDPSSCVLKDYVFSSVPGGGELLLRYEVPENAIEVTVKLRLEHLADYVDAGLMIRNISPTADKALYTSFPYLSGIGIGANPEDNLTINMWDRGYPGSKAWDKSVGGVYGKEVSMQWQCVYTKGVPQGLSFITMDTALTNKILCTFPKGGMQAFYFDKQILKPAQSISFPAARIQLFSGSWRKAARRYEEWFGQTMNPRAIPEWYRSVGMRGSEWFPAPRQENQPAPSGALTSYKDLFRLFAQRYDDVIEIAQWNEDVYLWPETYGPWMSSGLLGFRSDLGGESAFREGVKRVHESGRKVALYVAGYGIRKTSPLFTHDSWKEWAIQDKEGNYNVDYRDGDKLHGIFVCPGYKPWQDHIIGVCKMLTKTGIDEIRLDELGFPFKPCYNVHHRHSSPYDANQWMNTYLRRVRMAVDSINPQLVLTTEYFVDYFNRYTNGALVMDYSGSEIDAMKVAMPEYLPLSYHAGAAEAAMKGAIPGKVMAQRKDWAWQHIGASPKADYGKYPDVEMKWQNLFHTFSSALIYGKVSDRDPVAINDSLWNGHLWKTDHYYLVTGGYDDARPMPHDYFALSVPGIPKELRYAYAYDLVSGKMKKVGMQKKKGEETTFNLTHSIAAVFIPLAGCPPLPVMNTLTMENQTVSVVVDLVADRARQKLSSQDLKIMAPGFQVFNLVVNPKRIAFDLKPADRERKAGNYYFSVEGKVLPLKHWFSWK